MYKYVNPYMPPCRNCSAYGMNFTQQAFNKSLSLMKKTVQDERADELFYDYLISVAPTREEKYIIISIRNDERNHRQWFKEIYRYYTGWEIQSKDGEAFIRPSSYIKGIIKAIFCELETMEKYRFIREGLPSRLYRDRVFRILTDEIKHSTKYTYILNKNSNMIQSNNRETREFTLSELAQYDGTMGKPAYVAVNGIVYDVSNISKWSGGKHYGLTAGKDLSSQFETCHAIESKLAKLPKVGVLKVQV